MWPLEMPGPSCGIAAGGRWIPISPISVSSIRGGGVIVFTKAGIPRFSGLAYAAAAAHHDDHHDDHQADHRRSAVRVLSFAVVNAMTFCLWNRERDLRIQVTWHYLTMMRP